MSLDISTIPDATLDDLARVEAKAELIGGRVVTLSPAGHRHNRIGLRIVSDLEAHSVRESGGVAYTDGMTFVVSGLKSGRKSFSPDVGFYAGAPAIDERDFVEGPPTFAVEVRSRGDYGKAAERQMAAKRADYFEAGTLVVWDVDPDARPVRVHRANEPGLPTVLLKGQEAEAEPAVPGWRIAVDRIFS